jgi:hypothetical protein
MDATQILVSGFGGFVIILFTIIGFFVRRIFKQLDGMQTVTSCNERIHNCFALREAYRETVRVETSALADDHKDLKKGFDELCRCLTRYTEGKCP